jgi:hypothetical protein
MAVRGDGRDRTSSQRLVGVLLVVAAVLGVLGWESPASAAAPVPEMEPRDTATAPVDVPTAGTSGGRSSLAQHLDPEGRLLPSASGADLDPTGYQVSTGPDGSPRFVASGGGAPAAATGTWDDRFGRPGVEFGAVNAVAVSGANVYIGGTFGTAASQQPPDGYRGVAHWDGRRWRPMGTGANDAVHAVVVHGGFVYIAGKFTSVGGVAAAGIARWNGAAWSALGTGLTGDSTGTLATSGIGNTLAVFGGKVIVGGHFWWAGGVVARSVAAWDGSAWSALGAGACNNTCTSAAHVRALAATATDLYMGGSFERAGSASSVRSVARWNGSAWSGMGGGVKRVLDPGRVDSIAVDGANVYVGGQFDTAGTTPANSIARWSGSAWSALGSGLTKPGVPSAVPAPEVLAIAVHNGSVYAGGDFETAGGVAARYLARWDGAAWFAVPTGTLNELPRSLTSTASGLVVTGPVRAGALQLNGIGRWTGTEWLVYGQGIVLGGYDYNTGGFGDLNALAVTSTGQIYAAGDFEQAGQVATKSIARWDGTRWHPLQGGVTDPLNGTLQLGVVHALAVDTNNNVYVGGRFTQAGGVAAANIAKWNGSSWSALGAGTNGPVYGLTLDGSTLFVGGSFTTAGPISAGSMARYDIGTGAWSRLHPTHQLYPGDSVRQFVIWHDWVFIGGTFAAFGGFHMFSLLAWNRVDNDFRSMGLGVNRLGQPGDVLALAVVGDHLYVGGRFGTAGFVTGPNQITAPGLARLDLNTELWSLVGNPTVNALSGTFAFQAVGTELYVGGDFTSAGGQPAERVARFSTTTGTWSPLGSGLVRHQADEGAQAFAVMGSDLLVGGEFVTAGGQPASSLSMYGMPPSVPGPPRNVTAAVVGGGAPLGSGAPAEGPIAEGALGALGAPLAADAAVAVSWAAPVSNGGSTITSYVATASPGGRTCTWTTGPLTCTVTGLQHNTDYVFTVRATNGVGTGPPSAASSPVRSSVGPRFHALTPARILDTRPGPDQVGLAGPFGPTQARVLQVTGNGGVPAGATAVILNVTAVNPSAASFLSLTPDALAPGQVPSTSSLNLTPGTVRPNLVMARLDGSGRTTIYNNSGSVHVLADVVGWFDDGTQAGDLLTALPPARIMDTRPPPERVGAHGALGPGQAAVVAVAGKGGIPVGATAAVLNVTSVNPTADSFLSLTPVLLGPGQVPSTSNLNLAAGQVRPNLVVVKLNAAGQISIYNNSGTVDVLVDVVGYFASDHGGTVETLTPARILDTRPGPTQTGLAGAFGPSQARVLQVTGRGGVPAGAEAVWMNVTSVNPTANSFLSLTPDSLAPGQVPTTSNLNLAAGQVVPNLVLVKLDANGRVTIYNNSGSVHVLGDVVGYVP